MITYLAEDIFTKIPAQPDSQKVTTLLAAELKQLNKKIVVLDDDPTGVQTVHDISVYTNWTKASIKQGFAEKSAMFFILTNSRGFTAEETEQVHREIATTVSEVAQENNQEFLFISRSDSTLRGHYPLETEILKEVVEAKTDTHFDGEVLIPFFKEGGRFTIDDVHFVQVDDQLVPAGETEFAKDKTFGYQASNLADWAEEKTNGRYRATDVTSISLADLRSLNLDKITNQLLQVKDFNKVVVNAVDYCDVQVFVIALIRALSQGKLFMFRSAAALTKILGGVSDQPLLTKANLIDSQATTGGLIMIGSHVKKTTEQLDQLRQLDDVLFIEFNVGAVLSDTTLAEEEFRVTTAVNAALERGQTVTVYTSRQRLDLGEDRESALLLSVKISKAITNIVQQLPVRPKFIIAKGGITSSDIGTNGLSVDRALVAGQIKPGIPVWYTGETSKFPQLPYIIFPGNVGAKTTLREVVALLNQ
ncbi:hydroxyacid dehydrogenase [Loigolactobacillus coryniformis]|uniref:four-carbon acid sugar kinase family protein n=1 Tax=Loigolactobacillus coryniformis TaxID=1610 RepID=UPI002341C372|nr:four-carbon acid sugar kinase family protein [Loigolactobacillus coryniformis]MDC4186041.1 hydroxyacid dehydrogenase [Loigolactobacillus coryniformis]